jgi:transketolase
VRTAFIKSLCDLAARDPRVWLVNGDLGFSVLEPFREQFPDRYVNAGVAEQNMTGIAAGLAQCGKIVFTYSIANFPTLRCLEQLRNDVCYHELPVKVVAVGGGYAYGAQGYTHHGIEDLAILRALPGMTVVAPADPAETAQAVPAMAARPGPCYLRLGKAGEPAVHSGVPDFRIGRAITVREGCDVTVIAIGGIAHYALGVVTRLAARGIRARLLSMHTLKPLDAAAVRRALDETGHIVTVEEQTVMGGLGSAVAEVLAEAGCPAGSFRRWAIPEGGWGRLGSQDYLRGLVGDLEQLIVDLLAAR